MTNKQKVKAIKEFIEIKFTHYRIEQMKPKGKDRIEYVIHGSQLFVADKKTDDFIKSLLKGSQDAAKFWKSLLK